MWLNVTVYAQSELFSTIGQLEFADVTLRLDINPSARKTRAHYALNTQHVITH